MVTLLSYSKDQAGHPPHLYPLPGLFISADLRRNLGILDGISHGFIFWKRIRLLYLFQAPCFFCCAILQRKILSGGIFIPIPFCLHLWYVRGDSHLNAYEYPPISLSWKPLSLVAHFPPSPILFYRARHPAPLFAFSKGVIVLISSAREWNKGESLGHDGIKHPEDGGLQRNL